MKAALLFLVLITWVSASSGQTLLTRADADTLRTRMSGSFTSENTIRQDSSDVSLHLNINSIWKHRIDGVWLYAEQSAGDALNKPVRQVVYHLFQINDSTIMNQAYDVINPARITGAWHKPEKFDTLHTDSLRIQMGCGIRLHKMKDGSYSGTTPEKQCMTNHAGAAYTTSRMTVYPNRLIIAETGWDMFGKPVWGMDSGAVVFIKDR